MVKTVKSAFDEFFREYVNLDPDRNVTARSSRDWLVNKIQEFPNNDDKFPQLHPLKKIFFGSFARKTKIRELDDIDIMIIIHAEGSIHTDYGDYVTLTVQDPAENLKRLCNTGTNTLNSRKVIEKFLSNLRDVSHYEKAEMKRREEAATLKLYSYSWNFDIVPCFAANKTPWPKDCFLIPDGNGNWKRTDPRLDRDRVTNVNISNDGNVLNVIRIMKYWNKRHTMPSMKSYLLENLLLDFYENQTKKASTFVRFEFAKALGHIINGIYKPVLDPKGIQGDLNSLDTDKRNKISIRAKLDFDKAIDALELENNGDTEASIKKWGEIFGPDFPNYG